MIYDLSAKENWFSFFFSTTHPLFFSLFICSIQTHNHREIPDSWPTCLGSLMLSSVVPDTSTLSSFLIYHQEALYQHGPSAAFPQHLFLVWEWRKQLMNISLSLFLPGASGQRVKVEPEVSSYPGQTVNLRCAFTDATGIQLTMVRYTYCCDTIVFIVFSQDLITTGYHRTLNWVCGVRF